MHVAALCCAGAVALGVVWWLLLPVLEAKDRSQLLCERVAAWSLGGRSLEPAELGAGICRLSVVVPAYNEVGCCAVLTE